MNRGKLTTPVDDDWETGDAIDWRYYWNIINRRKWAISESVNGERGSSPTK